MSFSHKIFFASGGLLALAILAASVFMLRQEVLRRSAPTGFYGSGFYSLSEALWNQGVTYADVIKMDAPAKWVTLDYQFSSLRVPYAGEWTIEGKPVLPISAPDPGLSEAEPEARTFRFGKYVSSGTFYSREYRLRFESVGQMPPDLNPLSRTENDCPDIKNTDGKLLALPPEKLTIGEVEGVAYLYGGAKGCATAFDFKRDGQVITLFKNYPIGQDDFSHRITPEMEEIIKGVKMPR